MSLANGFEEILTGFRTGAGSDRWAQAYMITGPPRGEALALAEEVLSLFFCTGAEKPCGSCRDCRDIQNRRHPDVLWIEPVLKSQMISVDQVRAIRSRMSQTGFAGRRKACVLIRADRLNEAASNAFLKTLEEPPGESLFLLLTDRPQAMLPTILSRCQRVAVGGAPEPVADSAEAELRGILAAAADAGPLSAIGKGRRMVVLLKAVKESVTEEEERKAREEKEITARGNEERKKDEEILAARISARYRERRTAIMEAMLLWQRDVLLLACGADEDRLHYHDRESLCALRQQSQAITVAEALRRVRVVELMQDQLERNLPEDSVFAVGFARMLGGGDSR